MFSQVANLRYKKGKTMQAIEMLFQIRSLIARAVDGLSEDAFFTIPSGFDNNIAWNLGHIIVTQ